MTSGALVAAVAACARPGNTPEGHASVSTVTMTAEAPAASIAQPDITSFLTRMPAKDGTVSCAQDPIIAHLPSGGSELSGDAAERSRRALAQQLTPLPRSGEIPEAAARGADACARILSLELNLLQHSDIGLTPAAITRALTKTGLLDPLVAADHFAASTGKACVAGRIVDGKPVLSIAPLPCTL
ncbi:hypothetical protein [Actinoplanes sp. NBRC 103695]|uniref:hypothetical protein n=1 Tax=Actinoplanes sp. NBRC 103695 TaxID=3032202 RepID=UPI0025551F82|nr:hypothetical protein [Actinoplanes sp. NBRC 103695]